MNFTVRKVIARDINCVMVKLGGSATRKVYFVRALLPSRNEISGFIISGYNKINLTRMFP